MSETGHSSENRPESFIMCDGHLPIPHIPGKLKFTGLHIILLFMPKKKLDSG